MKMKTVYYLLLGLCLATAACKPDEPELPEPEEPKDEIISGTCGENLTWSYNKTKAILTISGTGKMENYSYTYSDLPHAPWFPYQEEIQTVIIGDSVTSIGNWAFYNCSALTQVTLPDSVTSIGYYAFYSCSALTQVTIPGSVTSIGEHAFEYCSALAEINVLATVPPTITASTFRNINPQVKVSIPEGSKEAYVADENWKWLLDLSAGQLSGTCGDNLTWTFTTADCTLTISGTGNMYDYNYRSDHHWYNFNQGIKNISLPDGMTSIGDKAFYGCSALTQVTIPGSVESIGEWAFEYCSALAEMTVLPTVPPTITANTFSNINPQVKVNIPEGSRDAYMADENWKQLLYLSAGELSGTCGDYLIWTFTTADCTLSISGRGEMYDYNYPSDQPWYNFNQGIKNISLPDGMTSIGDEAFYGCSALTQVTIPDGVTSIGGAAFDNCSALTQVDIPNSVTSIGDYAFYNCSALTQVILPNSVTNIGGRAFANCYALTQVDIPNSVTSIGFDAFLGTALYNNANNWTNNVLYIDNCLIEAKEELSGSYEIAAGTRVIAHSAFVRCSALTQVTIPSSVKSIGSYAFWNCSALTEMTVLPTVPPTVGSYAFNGGSHDIPVYVPAESLEAYKAVKGWKEFTNLQAIP